MSDIGPGTELEFIGPETINGKCAGLMIGAIYVCRKVQDGRSECKVCGSSTDIALTILTPYRWYCSCVFRPLRDGQERIPAKATTRICEPA